jgi:hypothetical protein
LDGDLEYAKIGINSLVTTYGLAHRTRRIVNLMSAGAPSIALGYRPAR